MNTKVKLDITMDMVTGDYTIGIEIDPPEEPIDAYVFAQAIRKALNTSLPCFAVGDEVEDYEETTEEFDA